VVLSWQQHLTASRTSNLSHQFNNCHTYATSVHSSASQTYANIHPTNSAYPTPAHVFIRYWYPSINHSPWDTVTLADFVMPFFLFMVGCSMSLAFKKFAQSGNKRALFKKAMWRTCKLFLLGLATQGAQSDPGFPDAGNPGFDLSRIRIPGILQRIAWAYGVMSLIVMGVPAATPTAKGTRGGYFSVFKALRGRWLVSSMFMVLYLSVMLGAHVPTWSYVMKFQPNGGGPTLLKEYTIECNMKSDLSPACSATRLVDKTLLGFRHLYNTGEFTRTPECSSCSPSECPKPFACNGTLAECPAPYFSTTCNGTECAEAWCGAQLDPEGSLSSFPGVVSAMIGFHFGTVLEHFPVDPMDPVRGHQNRLKQWVPFSLVLILIGIFIQVSGWMANKQIWSPAYVAIMAGANGLALVFFYCFLDYTEWQPRAFKRYKVTSVLRPFVWVGMNTIFVYLLSPASGTVESVQGYFWWKKPENNLLDASYRNIFCGKPYALSPPSGGQNAIKVWSEGDCDGHGNQCFWWDSICTEGMFADKRQNHAQLLWILGRISFWFGVAGWLHYKKWYWAL
jgi:heparan-alpha-glucosaminide N-acetyltransferase